jgi:hypothetical protein
MMSLIQLIGPKKVRLAEPYSGGHWLLLSALSRRCTSTTVTVLPKNLI